MIKTIAGKLPEKFQAFGGFENFAFQALVGCYYLLNYKGTSWEWGKFKKELPSRDRIYNEMK